MEQSVAVPSLEDLELANKKVEEGKLCMKSKEYDGAQDSFSQALEILVAKYGELADECAEVYFLYGCSLLSGAKQEGVDFLSKKVQEKIKEKETGMRDDEVEEDLEPEADETLALSYEIFETARVIYSRNPDKRLEVARVHLKLGKVNEESDKLEEAVEEYTQSLKLRQAVLPEGDDPLIIKTYARLASLHSFYGNKGDALTNFKQASELARHRIERLEKAEEKDADGGQLDAARRLLADLDEKVEGIMQWERDQEDKAAKGDGKGEGAKIATISVVEGSKRRTEAFLKDSEGLDSAECSSDFFAAPSSSCGPAAVVHDLGVFGGIRRRPVEVGNGKGKEKEKEKEQEKEKGPQKRKREEENNGKGNMPNGDTRMKDEEDEEEEEEEEEKEGEVVAKRQRLEEGD